MGIGPLHRGRPVSFSVSQKSSREGVFKLLIPRRRTPSISVSQKVHLVGHPRSPISHLEALFSWSAPL